MVRLLKNSIIQIFKSILIKHRQRYAATYSPHLVSITERFEHNQKFIKLSMLKNILSKVSKYKNLTHFEKLVVAFGIFIKDLKLDWAIGEYGLFGRLDGLGHYLINLIIILLVLFHGIILIGQKQRNETLKL